MYNLINKLKNNNKILSVLLNTHNLFSSRINIGSKNNSNIGLIIAKNSKIKISGENNFIIIKDYARLIDCKIHISGNNNTVIIGERAVLNKTNILIAGNNNEFLMGNHTTTNSFVEFNVIDGTKIEIGEDCMISRNINFWTGDYHSVLNTEGERINFSESIKIGDHVWVGTESNILKGVEIQNNSVVAAGSLLTKKFDKENVVIAGTPAKIINNNIHWTRENIKKQEALDKNLEIIIPQTQL